METEIKSLKERIARLEERSRIAGENINKLSLAVFILFVLLLVAVIVLQQCYLKNHERISDANKELSINREYKVH